MVWAAGLEGAGLGWDLPARPLSTTFPIKFWASLQTGSPVTARMVLLLHLCCPHTWLMLPDALESRVWMVRATCIPLRRTLPQSFLYPLLRTGKQGQPEQNCETSEVQAFVPSYVSPFPPAGFVHLPFGEWWIGGTKSGLGTRGLATA